MIEAIRGAVAAGDYARAAELFDGYARVLPLSESALTEIAQLLLWTRNTVLCARAHAEERLRLAHAEFHALSAYGRPTQTR